MHPAGRNIVATGLVPGAIVLTLDGEMPVEFLGPGDRVISRDAGMVELRRVSVAPVRCEMIEICGGALGHTRPERNVILPADQKLLLRDWRAQALYGKPQALATLRDLVDGEFVRHVGHRDTRLISLGFDGNHILYVDGLELAFERPEQLRKAA
ncbi:MAG: hypothetical protein CSA70_11180 [Rhodobacterales bacterium]|nr:MAG: hypothetical protein CSA70_11180 [Rhodobacterales bacterium]